MCRWIMLYLTSAVYADLCDDVERGEITLSERLLFTCTQNAVRSVIAERFSSSLFVHQIIRSAPAVSLKAHQMAMQ